MRGREALTDDFKKSQSHTFPDRLMAYFFFSNTSAHKHFKWYSTLCAIVPFGHIFPLVLSAIHSFSDEISQTISNMLAKHTLCVFGIFSNFFHAHFSLFRVFYSFFLMTLHAVFISILANKSYI